MSTADAVVIGGGIAGVSVAARLAERGLHVRLAEMEPTLAFHTTGRSAAQYLKNYGNDVVRRLTIASADYFESAGETPLWSPRSFLRVGAANHAETLRAEAEAALALAPTTEFLDGDETRRLVPSLSGDVAAALYEPDSMELDLAAFHQSFVSRLRACGGEITTSRPVVALSREGHWRVSLDDGTAIETPLVINASGAWGDEVAALAGVTPVGLHPRRRTVAVVPVPDEIDSEGWPLIAFENGENGMDGYCKPEPGGLLVSPADETPAPPADAKPEEIDIALALEGLNRWTTLDARHVRSSWAGLRTFAADRSPVAGFAPDSPGFFWMVGQGGYGIQMAPGLADAAAGLIVDGVLPGHLASAGLTPADMAAERPGLAGELTPDH
jgi:D-arginine dehydrogenase